MSDEQQEITPAELAAAKVAYPSIQLVDVREPWEVAIVALPDAIVLPLRSLPDLTDAIDPSCPWSCTAITARGPNRRGRTSR